MSIGERRYFLWQAFLLKAAFLLNKAILLGAAALIKLLFWMSVALLCVAALSCAVISFENLDIGMSVGADDTCWSGEKLLIDFSIEPERASFEKILILEKDGAALSFDMEGAGSRFALRPVEGWKKGSVYRLAMDGVISMKDGRSYTARETRHFMYGGADGLLRLVRPPQKNLTNLDDAISFSFSKPVVRAAFISAFSISPNSKTQFFFEDGGRSVLVKPGEKWPLNTTLEWKIDTKLCAEDGYILDKNYEGVTRTIFDVELPRLVSVYPAQKIGEEYMPLPPHDLNSLRERQPIAFTFSKPMDARSVVGGIGFEPNIKGAFFALGEDCKISALDDDCTVFVFEPYTNYEIGTEYRLCVGTGCSDKNGLALYEDEFRFFTCANEYLNVKTITACGVKLLGEADGENSPGKSNGKKAIAKKGIEEVTLPSTKLLSAVIEFSTAIGGAQKLQAERAISCSALFPSTASNPQLVSLTWSKEDTTARAEWTGASASKTDDNYYQIKIAGGKNGLVNAAGEHLKEEVCVTFIVRGPQGGN